ncbi:hypothetical protein D3C78_514460 [compost metagenome]
MLFQRTDHRSLVARQHLGVHVVQPQRFGHHPRAAAVVAGDQVAGDAAPTQFLHGLGRARLEGVAEGEEGEYARLRLDLDQPGQGAALVFPVRCGGFHPARLQTLLVEQAAVAEGQ